MTRIARNVFLAASLLLLTSVLLAGRSGAAEKPFPAHIDGATNITADQVKAMVDQGKKILIVDSRVATEYKESHIPGAINIPTKDMEAHRDKLPKGKNFPIVFYCNGPPCPKSYEACTKAVEWGYKQVYWLRGGLPEWKERRYATN